MIYFKLGMGHNAPNLDWKKKKKTHWWQADFVRWRTNSKQSFI
jgi:hypothetical protein